MSNQQLSLGSNFTLVVDNPEVVKGDPKALRFSFLAIRNGEVLFESPFWRILNGHLTPPSARDAKGRYWPTILMNDTDLRTIERWVTQQWAPHFPTVRWSQFEESKGESK